ncbi:hypothetical protein Rruber_02655 [Rhodococcus ruber]
MAEAETVDKSARLDKLANAEIEQAKQDRSNASAFLLIFFVTAVVFFALGNPIAGGLILSVPVLQVVRTFFSGGDNQPKKSEE